MQSPTPTVHMPNCTTCGHDSPAGSVFCLNCGSRLAAPAAAPVRPAYGAQGLPAPADAAQSGIRCAACGTSNASTMNFCRNCGSSLKAAPAPAPAPSPTPVPTPTPMRMPSAADVVGRQTPRPAAAKQADTLQSPAAPKTSPPGSRPPGVPSRPGQAPSNGGRGDGNVAVAATLAANADQAAQLLRDDVGRRRTLEEDPGVVSTLPETPLDDLAAREAVGGAGRSGGMGGVVRTPAPGASAQVGGPMPPTLNQFNDPARSARPVAAAWGRLVSVRQDGSDGRVYPLTSDSVTVGRDGELRFPDDRFLALEHARLDHRGGAPRLVPLDTVNGVFRRVTEPTLLSSGDLILLGRELMRYEDVPPEEREVSAVVQHGVARFGSPAREPWGRVYELLANGAVRDIRHLTGEQMIIGREEGHLLYTKDEFLSRRHAALKWQGGRCVLEDLGSSNGTYVRVRGEINLTGMEHLRMGNQLFRFEAAT